MVNSQIQQEISNAFKIDERVEKIPSAIPVVDVSLKHSKSINVIESGIGTATSTTIYTTPTSQFFYLKGFLLNHLRDGANPGTTYGLSFVVNGATKTINFPVRTALALTNPIIQSLELENPIKIDKGTTINVLNADATVLVKTSLCIYGFLDEVD
jgi:hypothetical protein